MTRFAFRVDNSVAIGAGHLVRCLTLARQLARVGGEVLFICRHVTDAIRAQIVSEEFALTVLPPEPAASGDLVHSGWLGTTQEADAEATIAALGQDAFAWLVVDHYALDVRWEKRLARHVGRILVIDDLADRPHQCDVLLDQNLQEDNRYAELVPDGARQLIGTRYALLRPEFRAAAAAHVHSSPARLNVFFGSTDPKGMTLVALQGLRQIENIAVDVIVGADNPHREGIAAACHDRQNVCVHVQPGDVAGLLALADLALGAGGTTSWERCCLGLPTLIVSVAGNQRAGTEALARAGAAIDMGQMEDVSAAQIQQAVQEVLAEPERLAAMRAAARALVDGRGAERVALHIMRDNVTLRNAKTDDAEAKWHWRNDWRTRQHFNDLGPVMLADHLKWWSRILASPDCALLIAQCGDTDIGVLRFDLGKGTATVSIYLDPDLTALGLGSPVLMAGTEWLRRHRPDIREALAEIHEDNMISAASFAQAEYRKQAGRLWTRALK